jgi:hypothetical protein
MISALDIFAIALAVWIAAILYAIWDCLRHQWRRDFEEREQYYKERADRKRGRVSLAPQWPADSGGGE